MKKTALTSIALALLSGCMSTHEQNSTEQLVTTQQTVTQGSQALSAVERKKAEKDDRGHRARPMTEERFTWLLSQYNADNDKQLTWAEYNDWRQARFNQTDANHNGTIDAEEYVYEFENRLDERYKKGRQAHVKQTNRRFESLDKNDDNVIEWSEYEASGNRIFSRWDTNEDGMINADDPKRKSAKQKSKYAKQKKGKKKTSSSWSSNNPIRYIKMPTTHNMKGLQSIYDANEDGAVSRDEFVNERRSTFYLADVNKDGKLSNAEYLAEFEDRVDQVVDKNRRAEIKQTYVRFNVLDDNKDLKMTFDEFQTSGKRIFTRWDKNKDGLISTDDIGK